MLKKLSIVGAALAMTATAIIPAAPAMAQSRAYGQAYRDDYNRGGYDNRYYNNRTYRGRDQRYRAYQKCNDGDGGTIVGAIAGGLLGNLVAGRGDKTLGTIIGGAGGALAGRAIDRSDRPNYCRR